MSRTIRLNVRKWRLPGSDNYTVNKNKVVYEKKKDDTERTTSDNSDQDDDNSEAVSKSSSRQSSKRGGSRTKRSRNSSKSSKRSSKSKQKTDNPKNVSVKAGDTLSEIAARNHTTVSKLKKLNNISGSNIRAGKKIRVK